MVGKCWLSPLFIFNLNVCWRPFSPLLSKLLYVFNFQSRSGLASLHLGHGRQKEEPGGLSRAKPPVPVRTCSLDRRPTDIFSEKLSFYESDGAPTWPDDTKTPTNENVHLLSHINNNNYAVPRGSTNNVNQFDLPPPSYDQIT